MLCFGLVVCLEEAMLIVMVQAGSNHLTSWWLSGIRGLESHVGDQPLVEQHPSLSLSPRRAWYQTTSSITFQ